MPKTLPTPEFQLTDEQVTTAERIMSTKGNWQSIGDGLSRLGYKRIGSFDASRQRWRKEGVVQGYFWLYTDRSGFKVRWSRTGSPRYPREKPFCTRSQVLWLALVGNGNVAIPECFDASAD